MTFTSYFGLFSIILSGLLTGGIVIALRSLVRWEWENVWLIFTLTGMIIMPGAVTLIFTPHIFLLYKTTGLEIIYLVILLGILWGLGLALIKFGLTVLGQVRGWGLIMGCAAIGATLLSGVFSNVPARSLTHELIFLCGVLCGLLGIYLYMTTDTGEVSPDPDLTERVDKSTTGTGMGIAASIVTGLLLCMLPLVFEVGRSMILQGTKLGLNRTQATVTLWNLFMISGGLCNLGYSGILLKKNKSLIRFQVSNTYHYWLTALLSGVIWFFYAFLFSTGLEQTNYSHTLKDWVLFVFSFLLSVAIVASLRNNRYPVTIYPQNRIYAGNGLGLAAVILMSAALVI